MSEANDKDAPRDRSPAFPVIPLETALSRLAEFDAHFKRSPARPEKVGDAWKIKTKAYADRIAAALRYFGLLDYEGGGKERQIVVSDEGRKYLRAQQEETKFEVVKSAALRPKQIAHFWSEWGRDRPADAACLDILILKNGFSEVGARNFLKVYDDTISFARLAESDKMVTQAPEPEDYGMEAAGQTTTAPHSASPIRERRHAADMSLAPPQIQSSHHREIQGERELTTGLLSKSASFRLLVSGAIGVAEIERLIKKLQIDKEILAEPDPAEDNEEIR